MRASLVLAGVLLTAPALAQSGDGTYGRIRGDLALSVEALGGVSSAGAWAPAGSVAVRARALDMVGLALGYDRAFGDGRYDFAHASVDFRPLFFARWAYDLERGPRWVDLMLDSLGLEVGVAWLRPGASDGGGASFVLGGGVDLPLWVGERSLWSFRIGARWLSAKRWDTQGPGRDDGGVEVLAGIAFRTMVRAGLVYAR